MASSYQKLRPRQPLSPVVAVTTPRPTVAYCYHVRMRTFMPVVAKIYAIGWEAVDTSAHGHAGLPPVALGITPV